MGHFIFGFIAGAIGFAIIYNNIHAKAVAKLEGKVKAYEDAIVTTLKNAFKSSSN